MSSFWIGILTGAFIGGCVTLFVLGMLMAASDADEVHTQIYENELAKDLERELKGSGITLCKTPDEYYGAKS